MKHSSNIWWCFIIGVLLFANVLAKKDLVPCPREDEMVCVYCNCDESDGFNTCTPMESCPGPVTSVSEIKERILDRSTKCIHGPTFVAKCHLCECSGEGGDHCSMCYALQARDTSQSPEINKKLPQPTDNRFFNYYINGWDRSEIEDPSQL